MAFWSRKKKKEQREPSAESRPRARRSRARKTRFLPLEVKLLALEALVAGLSPGAVAELAGVSPSTVSSWRRAYDQGGIRGLVKRTTGNGTRRICKELEARIVAMREAHPEKGVRRIRDDLRREEAVAVSAETIRRVVNDAGLGNPPPQPKRKPPAVRRFERSLPNAMWQIDIFTFELKRMFRVYLVGIIDDHSRYIVGHGLFRQQKAEAVLEVVRGAIGQWGAPREMLSDNGRQFVAWRGKTQFQKVLKRQGVQHVRSAPHHPMTLGKIERFWKTVWDEFLHDAVFASFADARQRLDHWVAYYNHQRPHQGIDGAAPADRFYGVADDVEEALRQGCDENALRLALGQETRPPLYLLGKLGETDVRVVRKGDDIEVRVGDAVREVIRVGAPYALNEDGTGRREGTDDEVEGAQRRGALPGSGDGAQGRGADQGDLRDLRRESADAEPGDGQGGPGVGAGAAAAEAWPQAEAGSRQEGRRAPRAGGNTEQGARALEDEVRGGEGVPGPGAQVRPWGAEGVAGVEDVAGEKKGTPQQERPEQVAQETDSTSYDELFWSWVERDGGAGS